MGYFPPSQYDSSHYSNDGWEYHQEVTDSKQSNQWRYASEPQDEQDNFMRYCPTPQNDSCHYANGGWEYQQGMREYGQSSEMNYIPKPQSDSYCYDTDTNYGWEGNFNASYSVHQETSSFDCAVNTYMEDFSPMPQHDPHYDEFNNDSHCGWKDQNQKAFDSLYSTYQEPSSLEHTFNSFIQNCPTSPFSFSFENSSPLEYTSVQDSFHTSQNNFTPTHPCPQDYSQPSSLELAEDLLKKSRELLKRQEQSWKRHEILFKKMDEHLEKIKKHSGLPSIEDENQSVSEEVEEEAPASSEISMKNEVVEVYEPRILYPQRPLEMTREHENSQPHKLP
ncbi:hypothetical protein AHAS_Ahas12G0109800 [Arachis hypogaea]